VYFGILEGVYSLDVGNHNKDAAGEDEEKSNDAQESDDIETIKDNYYRGKKAFSKATRTTHENEPF
jgi:hypothetical protein